MTDLVRLIDGLYTTTSNQARREMMQELQQFFKSPEAWAALFHLFSDVLNDNKHEMPTAVRKRKARVCFFAANALLSKIKRHLPELTEMEKAQLAENVHGLLFGAGLVVRDAGSELLGKPCTKRVVLCLATLSSGQSTVLAYVSHACSLVQSRDANVVDLGMEMLLAIAGGGDDDDDDTGDGEEEERVNGTNSNTGSTGNNLKSVVHQVLSVLCNTMTQQRGYTVLWLDTLHVWIKVLGDIQEFALRYPPLFQYSLDSISSTVSLEDVDLARTSSCLLQTIAECTPPSCFTVKDALQRSILLTRHSIFGNDGDDEDVQQAVASAFAQIAESDAVRIYRTGNVAMLDFALDILRSRANRCAVSKNVIDFFLGMLDLPLHEIPNGLELCIQVLHTLHITCQYSTSLQDNEDVSMFRKAGDGPKDLFIGLYLTLQDGFVEWCVNKVLATAQQQQQTWFEAESALFALRCASTEICDDEARNVLRVFYPAVLQVASSDGKQLFREEMFCAMGEFAQLMDQTVAFRAFDFLVGDLEHSADACMAFYRLAVQHAMLYAPYAEALITRVLLQSKVFARNAKGSKRVGEGLMLIAVEYNSNGNGIDMCAALMHAFLQLPLLTTACQCRILAQMIKPLPQDFTKVQAILTGARFWEFWEYHFTVRDWNEEDEDAIQATCELLSQCMRFGDGSLILGGRLPGVLNWTASRFTQHGASLVCLADLLSNCIEQCSSLLTAADCSQLVSILFTSQENVIEALRKALIYFPSAVFANNMVPLDSICEYIIHRISVEDRLASKLLVDMIARTRKQEDEMTAWSVHANALDAALLSRLDRIFDSMVLGFADDADSLLYLLFIHFPEWAMYRSRDLYSSSSARDSIAFRKLFKATVK